MVGKKSSKKAPPGAGREPLAAKRKTDNLPEGEASEQEPPKKSVKGAQEGQEGEPLKLVKVTIEHCLS